MAAVALTAARIAMVFPRDAEVYDFVAAATITKGQAVYINSAGKIDLADANAAGKEQFRGIALTGGGAGQAITVLKRGHVYGYTLTSAYDAVLYLSDTAGGLDTSAGTLSVICGRVIPLSDAGTYTKVLYINADWLRAWS